MPVQKTPAADLKRRYPLYAEAGLALALGAVILAFTFPSASAETAVFGTEVDDPIVFLPVPPTEQPNLPPPPPPAPPPPVEVDDDVEVDDVLAEVDLAMDEYVVAPVAPPSHPERTVVSPPTPPIAPPVVPTPPVTLIEETASDRVFVIVEQQPVLIGGLDALQSAVVYPELAQRVGIEGRVVVQFVVDERGAVTEPVVVRSPHETLSEAALAAVRQIAFEPGQQRGRPVKVQMTVPVTFRLR